MNATRCRGVFTYDEMVAAAMARFKAHGDIRLARWVAWELASLCDALWPGALLVPVPGSPRNARRRGWDHMEEVARELRRRGLMTSRLLTRRDGPEQKGLDREARRTSVSRSLVLRDARRLRVGAEQARPMPRTVVLIDDVRTTGATIEAAATLLRCGGYSVEGAAMLAVR
ncbi:MAG: ComF family protein [Spirochaetota bacterium]